MMSRHADLFTAGIVIAASAGNLPINSLATIPTYVIHRRQDEVAAFEDTENTAEQLAKLGRTIKFEPLDRIRHFDLGPYSNAIQRAGTWVAEQWTNSIRTQ